MSAPSAAALARTLAEALEEPGLRIETLAPVGGGCIHRAWRAVDARGRSWFVKANDARALPMFEAEREGLAALAGAGAVRVPRAVATGTDGRAAWLVAEWLELRPLSPRAEEALGAQLAALHRHTHERFGFPADNFIGATPQPNGFSDDWIAFLRERRLGFQLRLAAARGFGSRLADAGERLLERLDAFFDGYRPAPSLLHGDLWGGNAAATDGDAPVIFDPAAYYGDREADLAMTELFGGFSARFHDAYRAHWPLDAGYRVRRDLYNLYHVLNHANLFGGGYAAQAERMMARLLAEVG